jgi:hypothetical protein
MMNLPMDQRPNALYERAKDHGRKIRAGFVTRERVMDDLYKSAFDAGISESAAKAIIDRGIADGMNEGASTERGFHAS